MKRACGVLLLIALLSQGVFAQDAHWQVDKSTHFIVHYGDVPADFVRRLISRSEELYDSISQGLGFRRFDFWLWENRAHMYIYHNARDFQSATGQPAWSSGAAAPGDKIIYTFYNAKGFFEITLPHELGHIIFREFVGFNNSAVPVWLDEGVASYQGHMDGPGLCSFLKDAAAKGTFIPLVKLSALSPYLMRDDEAVKLFYAESAAIVYYLIKEYGKESFVTFCQALRDKKDLNRAIASAYPFGTLQELDGSWFRYCNR